jgi:hypothetical protein
LDHFWRVLQWKMLEYVMDICSRYYTAIRYTYFKDIT